MYNTLYDNEIHGLHIARLRAEQDQQKKKHDGYIKLVLMRFKHAEISIKRSQLEGRTTNQLKNLLAELEGLLEERLLREEAPGSREVGGPSSLNLKKADRGFSKI